MYLNGMGRKQSFPAAPPRVRSARMRCDDEIPEITEIDELYAKRYPLGQTFVGCKKNKFWIGSVVNHWNQGILLWTVGDRSHQTIDHY